MKWFRNCLRRLIVWALTDSFESMMQQAVREGQLAANKEVDKFRDQLDALLALDVDCYPIHRVGHIVLIAKVSNRPCVRVISVPPEWSIADYREFVKRVEDEYGIKQQVADLPAGIPAEAFFKDI